MATTPLTFGGDEPFASAPDHLHAQLADLEVIARLLPDVESSRRVDERTLECVVRPGVSFLRGRLTATIQAVPAEPAASPPTHLAWHIVTKGIGVEIALETAVDLLPTTPSGTQLTWQATITRRTGLVAALSPALLQAAAEQTIRQGWSRLRESLG